MLCDVFIRLASCVARHLTISVPHLKPHSCNLAPPSGFVLDPVANSVFPRQVPVSDFARRNMQKAALTGSSGPGKGSGTAAAAASQQAAALQSSKVDSTLVTLRMRALDVHARLAELGDGVAQLRDGLGPGRNLTWNEFLNKFHALSQLYVQLTTELERAVTDMGLENYILQPRGVAEDPGIVPDLLRTKQEPEVERDRDALASEFRTEVGESGMTDEAISRRIHAFNALVDSTIDQFKDLREDMALPKLAEPQPKRPPPAADAILAALTSGAGLR